MSWHSLLRRPTFWGSLALALSIGVVWIAVAAHSAAPLTLDDRVHAVAAQLQCPVCHNGESAADSSSEEAAQMRALIRQQLQAGWSEQKIIQYFHDRYGDAILESPPAHGFTVLIWLVPLLALLAGAGVVILAAREWRPALARAPADDDDTTDAEMGLPAEERAHLAEVLRLELAAEEGFDGVLAEGIARSGVIEQDMAELPANPARGGGLRGRRPPSRGLQPLGTLPGVTAGKLRHRPVGGEDPGLEGI